MDAWIKGIRYITVVYYNYVEPAAARELLQAAEIMGVDVRIGLEFRTPFRIASSVSSGPRAASPIPRRFCPSSPSGLWSPS